MEETIKENKPTWTPSEVLNNAYKYKENLQKWEEHSKRQPGNYAFPFFSDWKEIVVQYSRNNDLSLDNISKADNWDFAKSISHLRSSTLYSKFLVNNISISSGYAFKLTEWYVLLALDFIRNPLEDDPHLFDSTKAHSYKIMWGFCIEVINRIIDDLGTIKFEWQGNIIELRDDESFKNFSKDISLIKKTLENVIKNQNSQNKTMDKIHIIVADLTNRYKELVEASNNINNNPITMNQLIEDAIKIIKDEKVVKWAMLASKTLKYTYLKIKGGVETKFKFLPLPNKEIEFKGLNSKKTEDLK